MNIKINQVIVAMLGAWLLGASAAAMASKPGNITDAEMGLLPRYCPDTMGFGYGDASYNTSPNAAKWVAIMGKGFWAVHHHCWALIKMRRAERLGMLAVHKQGHWRSALADFWYVVNHSPRDFILLPEIFTWIGRTEILLGNASNADEAFAKARAEKPDYWPAYYHWAEYLVATSRKDEAMAIIKTGLQHSPNAKPLISLFSYIGGKLGEIPPPITRQERAIPPEITDDETNLQSTPEATSVNQRP